MYGFPNVFGLHSHVFCKGLYSQWALFPQDGLHVGVVIAKFNNSLINIIHKEFPM